MAMRLKVENASTAEAPVALRFPTGCPAHKRKGKTDIDPEGKGVSVTRRETQYPVSFVGAAEEGSQEAPCRYALGVFQPSRGTLKLVSLLGDGVVRMEPRVEGLQYIPVGQVSEGLERQKGNDATLLAFGDARTKKRLRQAELNQPALQSAQEGDVMDALVESITAKARRDGLTRDQVRQQASTESRVLPPHCGEGRSTEDAYPFDLLCPASYQGYLEVDQFLAAIDSVRDELELRKNGESIFVILQLKKLQSVNDEEERRRKVLRLSYMNVLMKAFRLSGRIRRCGAQKRLESLAEEKDINFAVIQYILSLFFETREEGRHVRHDLPEGKKKLFCLYIFVLALMVTNSELDSEALEQLRGELKFSHKKMAEYFESLGAKFTRKAKVAWSGVCLLMDGKSLDESLPKMKRTTQAHKR